MAIADALKVNNTITNIKYGSRSFVMCFPCYVPFEFDTICRYLLPSLFQKMLKTNDIIKQGSSTLRNHHSLCNCTLFLLLRR
jgi:hypothetical protein